MPNDSVPAHSGSWGYGESLRCERERQAISLDDIARSTRIPQRYLAAIEAGEFDRLPGLFFTRTFVRQYAEALQIDAEPIVSTLPKLQESMVHLPDPPMHPQRRHQFPGEDLPWIWLALTIVTGFFLYTHFNDPQFRTAARADTVGPSDTAIRSTAIEVHPALSRSAAGEKPPSATVITPAAGGDSLAAGTSSTSPVRVTITALQDAWVQLNAGGKTLFVGILRPHETKEILAPEQVELVAGNAGGISVSLNGRTLDPLGREGQVRHVRLTAEGRHLIEMSQPPVSDFAPPDSDSPEPPANAPL